MLYLVSGSSRSGKTLIAKDLLKQKQLPYLSLDWLVMGFTNGVPEYGVHDKLFPDEIARRMWPFLKAMFESMLWVGDDVVIEGEAILPELIVELLDQHPGQIRVCFVGYCDVDVEQKAADIRTFSDGQGDWLFKESDETVREHTKNMVAHSRMIKAGCQEHALPYFDTSDNFLEGVAEAIAYLSSVP
jgi:hypothetical protein